MLQSPSAEQRALGPAMLLPLPLPLLLRKAPGAPSRCRALALALARAHTPRVSAPTGSGSAGRAAWLAAGGGLARWQPRAGLGVGLSAAAGGRAWGKAPAPGAAAEPR